MRLQNFGSRRGALHFLRLLVPGGVVFGDVAGTTAGEAADAEHEGATAGGLELTIFCTEFESAT
jgi:hypothetical protein